jgi:hypothetical protein
MLTKRILVPATGLIVALLLAGCRVESNKNGDNKDVKISTPFGGLHVTTDRAQVLEEIGLPAYPGSEPVSKESKNGAADVNMSVGSFQLRVKAVTYHTNDDPDKVKEFYRDQLKRYGDVIECRENRAVGTPTHTLEGLTCDKQSGGHISVDDHPGSNEFELRTGSKNHMRIVSMTPEGTGTKFGLVVLDLPGSMSSDKQDDDHRQ